MKLTLAIRKREALGNTFLEVYFKGNEQNILVPSWDLKRFKGRYDAPMYFESSTVFQIKSNAQPHAFRTKENILNDGVWLVESDWLGKGGVPAANIPYIATYFGISVDAPNDLKTDWISIQEKLKVQKHDAPIVVYHGTAKDLVKSILENGLKPSYGMFGDAIYFGSFWKSFRFACLTQDYKDRHGALIRCLVFWKKTYLRNKDALPSCNCLNCKGNPTYADHLQEWAKTDADNIMLYPAMLNGHWMVRNEEYASLTATKIVMDTIGFVKRISEGVYEPWDRTVCIL